MCRSMTLIQYIFIINNETCMSYAADKGKGGLGAKKGAVHRVPERDSQKVEEVSDKHSLQLATEVTSK